MRRNRRKAFTLIEILTVMVIILILAGLVISISRYATVKGKRSRAQTEIQAMSAGCESYKADNGIYPDDGTSTGTTYTAGDAATLDPRTMGDPTATTYQKASLVLYRALSGDRNCDGQVNTVDGPYDLHGVSSGTSAVAPPVYMSFTPSQLILSGSTVIAISDPFRYSYGYSTAYAADVLNQKTPSHGYNPTYDLWSTAGGIKPPSNVGTPNDTVTPTWIKNW